jgi:GalNAc-alpha-(1->4)-GalNAc-alpha-(1->3)-diNAcBac-PP-undecaprenol alpha-1,4-N-acetyl-D-galactosaminyltransferase
MRLTLIISHLSIGGAQRVFSIMANYWAKKGWQITLLTFDNNDNEPFYDLHPAIIHRPLDIFRESANAFEAVSNNITRIRALRKAIKSSKPQAVICFMRQTNVVAILASIGLKYPVIISERSIPAYDRYSKAWERLIQWCYRKSFRLIVQNQAVLKHFADDTKLKAQVIPNPIIKPNSFEPEKRKATRSTANVLVTLGRLSREKGYDLLLKAYAIISPKHPTWSLEIWGEGPHRTSLEKLRDELGLNDKVSLPGLTKQSTEKLQHADLFVLASRYEGFPNALCEAMACGLPVISFDCPSGPLEIIRDGLDGILVPPENIEALAAAMDRLMGDEEERDHLAKRAPEVIERFGLEKVMGAWEEVITSSLENQNH